MLLRPAHRARPVALGLLLALILAASGACSGNDSSTPPPSPPSLSPEPTNTQADPCAPPPPSQRPGLHLCLSGAITGSALVPSRDATTCTGQLPSSFSGTFITLINSIETRLDLTDNTGVGTFGLSDPVADVTVTVVQAGQKSWSSIAGTPTGSVTVAGDRSGSLDVTLARRDLASGAELAGAPLRVRGTFRCPA